MRLLSLASLGSSNSEIPYSIIQKSLQIEEQEVESWIINAISEKIMDAKMDQLKHIVIVNRCIQRVFTKLQWKQLSDSLLNWKTNVRSLITTLQETKQQHFTSITH
jgi:translation initiation factor 3 subunit M